MSEVPSIRLEGLFGEIPLRSSGDFAVAADIEVPECEGLARAPLIVCVARRDILAGHLSCNGRVRPRRARLRGGSGGPV